MTPSVHTAQPRLPNAPCVLSSTSAGWLLSTPRPCHMAGQTEPLIAAVKAGNVGVATQLANSVNASLKDTVRPLCAAFLEPSRLTPPAHLPTSRTARR